MACLSISDLGKTNAMGLDAYVTCRCWEDGLCDPPISLASRLWYDPVRAEVNVRELEGLSAQESLALYLQDDLWFEESACAHRTMRIALERISNWGGLRAFKHALRSLGEDIYPTLLREIPNTNGGVTQPADARLCLAELSRFSAVGPFGQIIELIEASSSDVIHSRIVPYDGWLGTDGATHISIRLTADGVLQIERGRAGVMRHDDDATVLFRSKAFSLAKAPTGEFLFTDLPSGRQHLCSSGFHGASDLCPSSFEVKQSLDDPARYAYCVEPLRRVFQAAIANDHPVLWN